MHILIIIDYVKVIFQGLAKKWKCNAKIDGKLFSCYIRLIYARKCQWLLSWMKYFLDRQCPLPWYYIVRRQKWKLPIVSTSFVFFFACICLSKINFCLKGILKNYVYSCKSFKNVTLLFLYSLLQNFRSFQFFYC